MGLLKLPLEIVSMLAELLDAVDVYSLKLSCRQFSSIMENEAICRIALQKVRYSRECKDATANRSFAQGLARWVGRQRAVRSARPFSVAIVAIADHFVYANGALCYTFGQDSLRVLLLEGQVRDEHRIDTQKLMVEAIPGSTPHGQYKFRPLYYNEGILSCLYSHRNKAASPSWLTVLSLPEHHIVNVEEIEVVLGAFVRNDKHWLYFGSYSFTYRDSSRRWALRGLNLQSGKWHTNRLILKDFIGSSIASTVCFEIFDGYFYGLSNQTPFEPSEGKWNSFYYAFRFRLGQHSHAQILPRHASWRRQGREGPTDDRWTYLELAQDEETGVICAVESRKEYLPTSSQSQRTCYRRELRFDDFSHDRVNHVRILDEMLEMKLDPADPKGMRAEAYQEKRSPSNVHAGDDESKDDCFTFQDSFIRSYHASCSSFVDLVNDPTRSSPDSQHLRLRIRSRALGGSRMSSHVDDSLKKVHDALAESEQGRHGAYEKARLWPPEQEEGSPDPQLEWLYHIMNPQKPASSVRWAQDDRFLLYSPRITGKAGPYAIVLISFDPSLRLVSLPKLCDEESTQSSSLRHLAFKEQLVNNPSDESKALEPPVRCGRSRSGQTLSSMKQDEETLTQSKISDPGDHHWASIQTPMYIDIMELTGRSHGFDIPRSSSSGRKHG